MDNLSHSLVGLAVGELLQRSLPPETDSMNQRLRHRMLLIACWAASNFPDLDLVFTPLLPQPLGYLLHHRGHTHTLLFAIPQAMLVIAIFWLWPAARRLLAASSNARRGLLLAAALGLGLHLAMDFLNSYGLHPFYPVDNRWLYGDMVFILEPVFWIATGVPLAMMPQRRPIRLLLLALLAGVPLFFAGSGFLHWGSVMLLALIGLAVAALQQRAGADGRLALSAGLFACLAFVAVQGAATARARQALAAELRLRDPASELVDAAMTAFPANPLCWNFVAIERNEAADTLRLRRGVLSLAPGVLPAQHCPLGLAGPAAEHTGSSQLAIVFEHSGSLAEFRRRAQDNCYFRAWLRFARAPLLSDSTASDLRFGNTLRANFSTIDLARFEGRACPAHVPPWDFPRADLLSARPAP